MRVVAHSMVAGPRAVPALAGGSLTTTQMLQLRVKPLWRWFRKQDLAFWAMCFYLIVEYVRPQQLFSFIYGAPLGKAALGLAVVAFVGSGRWFKLKGFATALFLLFTIVIILSSITAFDSTTAYADLRQIWLPWVLVFILLINVIDTEQKFVFFLILWLLCHYYMAQGGFKQFAFRGFRFAPWGITGQPGWFHNSGEFAIAMAMFTAVSWHFYQAAKPGLTRWRKVFVLGMPALGGICVLGSSSRGAVLALAAVAMWLVLRSKQRARTIGGLLALAVIGWIILPPEQKARFSSAGEDRTSTKRIEYWKAGLQMAADRPALGIGFGNWVPFYRAFYRAGSMGFIQVSHNIFIQCMAELGYTGLLVFLALIIATLVVSNDTRKRAAAGPDPPNTAVIHLTVGLDSAMVCYLVAGFFVTVLYYPFFWINLALTVALNAIVRNKMAARGVAQRVPVMQGRRSSGAMRVAR